MSVVVLLRRVEYEVCWCRVPQNPDAVLDLNDCAIDWHRDLVVYEAFR